MYIVIFLFKKDFFCDTLLIFNFKRALFFRSQLFIYSKDLYFFYCYCSIKRLREPRALVFSNLKQICCKVFHKRDRRCIKANQRSSYPLKGSFKQVQKLEMACSFLVFKESLQPFPDEKAEKSQKRDQSNERLHKTI